MLTIIIPVYNEINTIEKILDKIDQINFISKEIILVDDCSSDGTKTLIERKLFKRVSKVIYHNTNNGKGSAIKSAQNFINGKYVIIQDADLEYDPSDYTKLLSPIITNKADVVYGSRFIGDSEKRVLFFWHRVGNLILTFLSNAFTNLNLSDMEVGYKAFKTECIKDIDLIEKRFGFEPEITAKIAKKKLRIFEVGIKYYGRTYDEGKKINWKDGFEAIYCIVKYNLFK